jgi:hypothetical protein
MEETNGLLSNMGESVIEGPPCGSNPQSDERKILENQEVRHFYLTVTTAMFVGTIENLVILAHSQEPKLHIKLLLRNVIFPSNT